MYVTEEICFLFSVFGLIWKRQSVVDFPLHQQELVTISVTCVLPRLHIPFLLRINPDQQDAILT